MNEALELHVEINRLSAGLNARYRYAYGVALLRARPPDARFVALLQPG